MAKQALWQDYFDAVSRQHGRHVWEKNDDDVTGRISFDADERGMVEVSLGVLESLLRAAGLKKVDPSA